MQQKKGNRCQTTQHCGKTGQDTKQQRFSTKLLPLKTFLAGAHATSTHMKMADETILALLADLDTEFCDICASIARYVRRNDCIMLINSNIRHKHT